MMLGGRQISLAAAMAVALLSSTLLLAAGPWNPDVTDMAVQRAQLVVRGVITSVTVQKVPNHGREYPSTVLGLNVSEVLAGDWNRPDMKVVLLGTRETGTEGVTYNYQKGEEVILCLRYDHDALNGVYRFYNDAQSLVNRKGTWMTRGGNAFSLDLVRAAARKNPAAKAPATPPAKKT